MSNSDYTLRGNGAFCPVAELSSDIAQLDTTVFIDHISYTSVGSIFVGMAAMVDDEVMKVTSVDVDRVEVTRGCCDTVPALHIEGTVIWFFDTNYGTDGRAYAATEEIAVKLLPFTGSSQVPIEASPPHDIEFSFRFARPYAPGQMQCNALPWFTTPPVLVGLDDDDLVLTWAERNRITQGDQLIDHSVGTITPEAGVTYEAKVYDDTDTLIATHDALTGTTWTYDYDQAYVDFGLTHGSTGTVDCYLVFSASRDSLLSYQSYKVPFQLNREWHA